MSRQNKPATHAQTHAFIPVSEPNLSPKETGYVLDCMETGWVSSLGTYINRFEKAFGEHVGAAEAISICNGTAALHTALLALGIGPGDQVIVPTFTYIASANAVHYTGATPVFVDIEEDTWNIDPKKIEAAVTPRTRAIMPVHIYGHPCDMDAILAIAKRKNLLVVEDAAEAFGTKYRGQHVGCLGDVGVFSFFGNKTITTGEGGMIVLKNTALAKTIRLIKGQGMSAERRYFFERVGYNYRMTNIEAAIGLGQLERASELISGKRRNALLYREGLSSTSGIGLPIEKDYAFNSFWMFSITVAPEFGRSRDELAEILKSKGIETRPFFIPLHTMPPYFQGTGKFPIAEFTSSIGLSLPSSTRLKTDDINRICAAIRAAKK